MMARTLHHCTLAPLVTLVILGMFPARSVCKEDTNRLLSEAKPVCCDSGEPELKRFDGIDYDSFVSLMGKRSAAQPNSHGPTSRKRHLDHILAALLGQRTSKTCPCDKETSQTRSSRFINYETKRFQHFLQ